MITGELKSKIDAVWNDFWSGGIANPLEVMEQLTYLLFIKGLDERQTLAERKANRTGQPIEDPVFANGDGPNIPRNYFHDDTAGTTGKVHVGFFRPHSYMSNTKT